MNRIDARILQLEAALVCSLQALNTAHRFRIDTLDCDSYELATKIEKILQQSEAAE